jgi:hypothetical protein
MDELSIQAELDELTRQCETTDTEQHRLRTSVTSAEERQRLRRLCDEQRDILHELQDVNTELREEQSDVDGDRSGKYKYDSVGGRRSFEQFGSSSNTSTYEQAQKEYRRKLKCDSQCFTSSVSHREFEWTIGGMSWLKPTLKQRRKHCAQSQRFALDRLFTQDEFALVYNPSGAGLQYPSPDSLISEFYDKRVQIPQDPNLKGSLAFTCTSPFVAMRYKFQIKRAGGDFEQWGEEQEYVKPSEFSGFHSPPFFGPGTFIHYTLIHTALIHYTLIHYTRIHTALIHYTFIH